MQPGVILDGRFRLDAHVGAGGMGVVFRAHDQQSGDTVAVKVLEGRNPGEIERARREAEALARLSHPAIVRHVADGMLPTGQIYVVMEWLEGITVADRIAGEGFTLRESVAVARGVGDALASAHRASVLHRDLKPSNIVLVGGDPAAPKLIDFGVARMADSVRALTRTGAAIGTPGYMSPEQARGERALTPAADVFGLACVLYECATAKPAFSGTAVAAVLAKILFADPPPLRAECPEASRELAAMLDRMLAKDAAARWTDCAELVAAFDALPPVVDGPRRTARRLNDDATRVANTDLEVHCMVGAARGDLDDVLEPPTELELAALVQAVHARGGHLEVLATGAVVAHLHGAARDASRRAGHVALAMKRILRGWSLAISAVKPDIAAAVEDGATRLTQVAMAAIFGKQPVDTIAVDPTTAELLADEFEVADSQLVRAKSG